MTLALLCRQAERALSLALRKVGAILALLLYPGSSSCPLV